MPGQWTLQRQFEGHEKEAQAFGYRGSDFCDELGLCEEQNKGSNPELIIIGEKSQELRQDRRAACWKTILLYHYFSENKYYHKCIFQ